MAYDGEGRPVARQILYNGALYTSLYLGTLEELASSSSGTTITQYDLLGGVPLGISTNGTIAYVTRDHLGSATVALDSSGSATASRLYDVRGVPRYFSPSGSMPGAEGYGGQHNGTYLSGLEAMGARNYEPYINQFASADTLLDGTAPPNRYAYVHDNPCTLVDPSGRCGENPIGDTVGKIKRGIVIAALWTTMNFPNLARVVMCIINPAACAQDANTPNGWAGSNTQGTGTSEVKYEEPPGQVPNTSGGGGDGCGGDKGTKTIQAWPPTEPGPAAAAQPAPFPPRPAYGPSPRGIRGDQVPDVNPHFPLTTVEWILRGEQRMAQYDWWLTHKSSPVQTANPAADPGWCIGPVCINPLAWGTALGSSVARALVEDAMSESSPETVPTAPIGGAGIAPVGGGGDPLDMNR